MKKVLVFRFSAMGDVALLLPALQAVISAHPGVQVTVVTRKKFAVFFHGYPEIKVMAADFEGQHKGLTGLLKLFRQLQKSGKYDALVDLHQNLRTAFLKALFRLWGVPAFTLDKGRADKKALTRRQNKVFRPLPHTVSRYLTTFRQAGFLPEIPQPPYFRLSPTFLRTQQKPLIGIAPFAQHAQKMWHFDNFFPLLTHLYAAFPEAQVFLFGGGASEIEQLQTLQQAFPQSTLIAGKLALVEELSLMQQLDVMVCMDSGNMHLAALSGVPVLSVWGATHPFAGFAPFGQADENILQVSHEELSCRPCSVFGNKPCWRGDLACLTRITPEMVFERLLTIFQGQAH